MSIISSSGSWLPNAFIRLVPVFCNVFSKSDQRFLRTAIKAAVQLPILRACINHLAVNIELKLFAGAIANAYRNRAAIAAQMHKFVLVWSKLAEYRVQNFEFGLRHARSMQQPG